MRKMQKVTALLLSLAIIISIPATGAYKGGKNSNTGNNGGVIRLMEFTEPPSITREK